MAMLNSTSIAVAMVGNFEKPHAPLDTDAKRDLADCFELMKEVFTQISVEDGHDDVKEALAFLRTCLYTVRFILLGWAIDDTKHMQSDMLVLPAASRWSVLHPCRAVFQRELLSVLRFIDMHQAYFVDQPWAWMLSVLQLLEPNLTPQMSEVLEFETGTVIF